MQQPSWYRQPGVSLFVHAPVRACQDGDVLLCEKDGQPQTWMLLSGGLVPIALRHDAPTDRHLDRGAVCAIAWSPDGKRFISAAQDNVMYLRTIGRQFSSSNYSRHGGTFVHAVSWSPDGTRIASGDNHDELHVWDVWDVAEETTTHPRGDASLGRILVCRTRERLLSCQGILATSWSPNSHFVATGGRSGEVRLWDVNTGRLMWTRLAHQGNVHALAWSPDGAFLASAGSDMTVQVWQVLSHKTWYDIGETTQGELQALAWSPDGTSLLLCGTGSQALRLYDAHRGQRSRQIPLSRYGASAGVHAVSWSPDGRFAAAGCADGSVQIVDVEQSKHIRTFHGHTGITSAVAWSPDGAHIASGGIDKRVLVWNVTANTEQP